MEKIQKKTSKLKPAFIPNIKSLVIFTSKVDFILIVINFSTLTLPLTLFLALFILIFLTLALLTGKLLTWFKGKLLPINLSKYY